MADASYPEDLRYHDQHDWARIEGDTATFGVTWYAWTPSARSSSSRAPRLATR